MTLCRWTRITADLAGLERPLIPGLVWLWGAPREDSSSFDRRDACSGGSRRSKTLA